MTNVMVFRVRHVMTHVMVFRVRRLNLPFNVLYATPRWKIHLGVSVRP